MLKSKYEDTTPPMGPENWEPNLDNKPKWRKVVVKTLMGNTILGELVKQILKIRNGEKVMPTRKE